MQNKVLKYLSYVGLVGEGPDVGLELEKLQRNKENKIEDLVSGNRTFRVVSFRGGGAKLMRYRRRGTPSVSHKIWHYLFG